MDVVHIVSEFAPFAKTGGLGDAVAGLCRELAKKDFTVSVILPKYKFLKITPDRLVSEFTTLGTTNRMWLKKVSNVNLYLLETVHPDDYFGREKIYGYQDDASRFIYFSHAACDFLQKEEKRIDILHLHDWHTAYCAFLLKTHYREMNIQNVILSIHNLEYQGRCYFDDFDRLGAKTDNTMQDNHPVYRNCFNLLKGGIVHADAIVTVSPSYAKEILTAEFGFNLETTLKEHSTKLIGLLNGIDYQGWNTHQNPYLPFCYGKENVLEGKEKNREALRQRFGLKKSGPWIGAITRLAYQKNPSLIEEALKETVKLGGVFILLGSSTNLEINLHFKKLQENYLNEETLIVLDYDERLAHQLYAALDFLIVPSKFEPCGLCPMIAMRYGTIPIVRKTGGLQDSVQEGYNGLMFYDDVGDGIERAFELYRNTTLFYQTIIQAMEMNFGWDFFVHHYEGLYSHLSGGLFALPAME